MAACVVGIRQWGLNPCRMVPSMRDEVHVQLHDVTGKVQSARAASCRAGTARFGIIKKKINKGRPRFRVNRIPEAGVKDPLSWGQETTELGGGVSAC